MQNFLDPQNILRQIELHSDMAAAEFGCGSGVFSIYLAKILEDGLVYAIDIQEAPLSALKSRANLEKIRNIKFLRSDLEKQRGSTLSDSSVDLVVISNVLFQIEDKNTIIKEAGRVLKKGGKMLVIDWLAEVSSGPVTGRVAPATVDKIAEDSGFDKIKEIDAGIYHYGFVFAKK
jgi:ubiquinone/menaquinone biosynthesis C-methylase UbiE